MRRGKSGIYRTRIKAKRREGRGGEGLFLFRGVRRALISAFSTRTAMLEGFPRKSFIKKTFFIFLVHYGHHIFSEAKKDTYNVKNSFSKHRFQELGHLRAQTGH